MSGTRAGAAAGCSGPTTWTPATTSGPASSPTSATRPRWSCPSTAARSWWSPRDPRTSPPPRPTRAPSTTTPPGPPEMLGRAPSSATTERRATSCGTSSCRSGGTTKPGGRTRGTSSTPSASAAPWARRTATSTSCTGVERPTASRPRAAGCCPRPTLVAPRGPRPWSCPERCFCRRGSPSRRTGTRPWSWSGWRRPGLRATSAPTHGSGHTSRAS
mmetsp:Transcript_60878/g.188503  ORF Transcript_60878/g.188503 Transcript_60878/m.188503 type:complete len:216 (-) Transcript_60878:261-908(-)